MRGHADFLDSIQIIPHPDTEWCGTWNKSIPYIFKKVYFKSHIYRKGRLMCQNNGSGRRCSLHKSAVISEALMGGGAAEQKRCVASVWSSGHTSGWQRWQTGKGQCMHAHIAFQYYWRCLIVFGLGRTPLSQAVSLKTNLNWVAKLNPTFAE